MGESDSGQQYCLRWNNHSDSIISEFEVLLGQEDFVDVTLSCERHSVKAHKVVLSACSKYFRRLLKDNPCQHPIIILRDVGYSELSAILYFMYHGQVMVEQERIPQLLQTAKLLEVRGLCEIREGQPVPASKDEKDGESLGNKGNQSFLAGLLNTSVSATKRSASVSDTNSCSTSSPTPPPSSKRLKSSGGSSRPVPMLQSILSQQLSAPSTPVPDVTKSMAHSTKTLVSLASKVQTKSLSPHVPSTSNSNISVKILPTTLENLLGGLTPVVRASTSTRALNNGGDNVSDSSASDVDDIVDKEDKVESSIGDIENSSSHGGHDVDTDGIVVEVKEEPLVDFEDEFGEDSSLRGVGDDEESESSENELGTMSDNSRGEAFSLPLLAQHLAAPNLLSASAKLRAAASQARHLSSSSNDSNPIMTQVIIGPSTPPDAGPASVSSRTDTSSPNFDPLGGDPPRKLAFHEPRPCPICRRMYRDAATLRTHTAIMHAEGRDPFACLCGELFRTKYEMYNHKKNGHR